MAFLGSEVVRHGVNGTPAIPYISFAGKVADVTAPTLSSPTSAAIGITTGSGTVSTDEGNGTLYWIVDQSATPPSVAQIQAGNDSGGVAADDSGSQAVSATGVQNISSTGLTASTTYYIHYQHQDSAANDSTVVTSASFTTYATPSGGVGVSNAGLIGGIFKI